MNKGIILAGGKGSRLRPLTTALSKQLLPIYDKPMVYYPLSVLMLAGIREILLISDPISLPVYERLLGDGSNFGIRIEYKEQVRAGGLPEAFIVGEEFIDGERHAMILGDNFFYGQGFSDILRNAALLRDNVLFVRSTPNPKEFGVCEFDANGILKRIVEKPVCPPSDLIATGLYFFNGDAPDIARLLRPSDRGELEIADMINCYASRKEISLIQLGRGCAWLDTGSFDGLHNAAAYVKTVQDQEGYKIGCIEEIAFRSGWISRSQLLALAKDMPSSFRSYLERISVT